MRMKNESIKGTSGDALSLTAVKLVTTVLGLAVTRLLSEYLSVHDYGTYTQVLLVVSTVTSMTILGMMDGVNFFHSSVPDASKRENYISTIFALQAVIGLIAGMIVMLASSLICGYFENPKLASLLYFGAVLPVLQNILGMVQILLVSVGKAKILALRNLLVSLFRLAMIVLVLQTVRSVVVVLTTTLILDVLQIVLFTWILKKCKCGIHIKQVDPKLIGRIMSYCAPMAIFVVVNTLNRDLDKYLIALWTDTQTLAVYANASKVLPFDILMASFCTVLLPQITKCIARRDLQNARKLYRLFLQISYTGTGILCCAALAASPQVMEVLYSSKYEDGLSVFCLYILVDLLRFTNITMILSATGRTMKLMVLGLGSLMANAILNVLLFNSMGIMGPALATVIITFVSGLLLLYFGAKELDTTIGNLFNTRHLVRFICESIVFVAIFYWLQGWLVQKGIHYFWIAVIVAGGYCSVMAVLHGPTLLRAVKQVNQSTKGN